MISSPGYSSGPLAAGARRERIGVLDLQRGRLIAALIAAVEARGYAAVTVGELLSRARISRKTFYEVFVDLDDCFLAAFEQTTAHARELLQAAYETERGWRAGTRAALLSLLTAMEDDRGLAKLCIVEAFGAGPRVLERRAQLLADLAQMIAGGRAIAKAGYEPSPLSPQATAGGIAELLHARLLREDPARLTDLLGPLMSVIVLPYVGRAAAYSELDAPVPRVRRARPRESVARDLDPLAQLNMRITYRTVRVLSAIAQTPGASNRQVAEGAGIVDQGQMSKLLARLERLALIENAGPDLGNRNVNAWSLAPLGSRVQRATSGRP